MQIESIITAQTKIEQSPLAYSTNRGVRKGVSHEIYVIPSDELIEVHTGRKTGLRYNDITGFVEPIEEP